MIDKGAAIRLDALLFNLLALAVGLYGLILTDDISIFGILCGTLVIYAGWNVWECVTGKMFASTVIMPRGLHETTQELVINTAKAMAAKLYISQIKYNLVSWNIIPEQEGELDTKRYFLNSRHCMEALMHHIGKGDPVDCLNYLAFMHHYGWKTYLPDVYKHADIGDELAKSIRKRVQEGA